MLWLQNEARSLTPKLRMEASARVQEDATRAPGLPRRAVQPEPRARLLLPLAAPPAPQEGTAAYGASLSSAVGRFSPRECVRAPHWDSGCVP